MADSGMIGGKSNRLLGQRRHSRTDEVQQRVKDLIIERGLGHGDTMPTEFELASQLGVGRNAIREAFKALQAVGIVDVRHGYGTYVSDVTLTGFTAGLLFHTRLAVAHHTQGMSELIDVRATLEEAYLVRRIIEMPDADLTALDVAVADMRAQAEAGEVSWDTDREFHRLLAAPFGNELLDVVLHGFWDVYHQLSDGLPAIDLPGSDVVKLHSDIVESIRAGDVELARGAMKEHFSAFRVGAYASATGSSGS